ncbi:hypothetical protein ACFQU1_03820 [Chelatococcus sp. GCM10030263]|uniref:hypothetical protein n=1 Tax=Chelatococcus sp. GCM10030263 TaxID=3273387 RepID=UPI00361C74A4
MVELAKVEAAMIFALGFFAAALLAAFFLPAFNRRTERLVRRRLEAQLPLSRQEMAAERDHLRADFAVAVRRLEREVEKQRTAYAKSQEELGKRIGTLNALEDELAERSRELDALQTLLVEARSNDLTADLHQKQATISELERVLRDTRTAVVERDATIAALEAKYQELKLDLDRRRISIVELETRHEADIARLADAEQKTAQILRELEKTVRRAEEAERQLDIEREHSETLAQAIADLTTRQDNQRSLLEMLEANEVAFAGKLTEATVTVARLRETLDERETTLAQTRARVAELEASLASATAEAADAKGRAARLDGGEATLATETAALRRRIEEIADAFVEPTGVTSSQRHVKV